jgi:hypothetical protein
MRKIYAEQKVQKAIPHLQVSLWGQTYFDFPLGVVFESTAESSIAQKPFTKKPPSTPTICPVM